MNAGLQSLEWWDRSECRRRVLCVDKVGGQVSFAFHVDYSSQSNIVSHTLNHLGSLLRHLEEEKAEDKKVQNDKFYKRENTFVGTDNDLRSEYMTWIF